MNKNILKNIVKNFTEETGFIPVTAAEIEFYLLADAEASLAKIKTLCKEKSIEIEKIEKEEEEGQFEISLKKSNSPIQTAKNIKILKEIIKSQANTELSAKPFENKKGNGLHIHISLLDSNGRNVFAKDGTKESDKMLFAIGGLCASMLESMAMFAPFEDSYKRFSQNDSSKTLENAPINISWGGNNRTTAIRIPTSTEEPEQRHIEHRVAGVDAEPHAVLSAILLGISYGIKNKVHPPEKVHGNAFDKQYNLTPLPKNLDEARKLFEEGKIIKEALLLDA